MIKCERKTLKTLRKKFNYDDIVYVEGNQLISDNITLSLPYDDLEHIIRSLSVQGYLTLHQHPLDTYFSISYEGIHKLEKDIDNFKLSFFTKWLPGFISGILVGVLSTLICYLLERYVLLFF